MRILAIAVLSAAAAGVHAADWLRTTIDLDQPGAMESLQQSKPEHYKKVAQIRELASHVPCVSGSFRRNLYARFDARDGACTLNLMTSFPGKRRLSFTLDELRYVTVVTMDAEGYRAIPLQADR